MDSSAEYRVLADRYDRRYRAYNLRTHRSMLQRLGPVPEGQVLDAGCGTGQLLARIERRAPGARLIGVDLSREMLAVARQRLGPTARLLQGRSEQLPLADHSIDLLLSNSSLHCSAEPTAVIGEFVRVLRPGGRLLLTDWCADAWSVRMICRGLHWSRRAPVRAARCEEVSGWMADAGLRINHLSRYRAGGPWDLYLVSACRAGGEDGSAR